MEMEMEMERERERWRDRESTSKESTNKRCSAQHDHTYIVVTFFCTLLIFIQESLSCGVTRSYNFLESVLEAPTRCVELVFLETCPFNCIRQQYILMPGTGSPWG